MQNTIKLLNMQVKEKNERKNSINHLCVLCLIIFVGSFVAGLLLRSEIMLTISIFAVLLAIILGVIEEVRASNSFSLEDRQFSDQVVDPLARTFRVRK
jgi:hypothetical protein